ncbi:TetR/AcrR family transcriptional regulator [Cohnella pontilimi]|uniref:TetR/AcrR family transcriptional regulator n=1 Tax=Cohnella pontilimi TaxID=2564100 RepID=A0A4U0FBW4_9BACL|nr:TetR/AcrR family transcriptional regulator [Cohnella pontilimi]TJY40702.1 TetR/AcrR family transcriptional regulator [Cohnella pontilimi]
MRKGQQTREYIIGKAARLFNRQGYRGSAISDIMEETGLRKGGIYNHFSSKDELAFEAFDYAVNVLKERYMKAIEGKESRVDQLISLFSIYNNIVEDPPLEGGCPLLNTAVDSDDTHPELKQKAQAAMNRWYDLVRMIIRSGIKKGEFRDDLDIEPVVTYLTATFEGGVMLSKLYGDSGYMQQTFRQMKAYILKELVK